MNHFGSSPRVSLEEQKDFFKHYSIITLMFPFIIKMLYSNYLLCIWLNVFFSIHLKHFNSSKFKCVYLYVAVSTITNLEIAPKMSKRIFFLPLYVRIA